METVLAENVKTSLAGGEDYGYFASGAGDAGSNPATGIIPVWSNGRTPHVPLLLVPRPMMCSVRVVHRKFRTVPVRK